MKLIRTLIGVTALLLLAGCGDEQRVLRIGSKDFTEQLILAEMIAQMAEREGIPVQRKIPYGDTFLNQEAVKAGDIDLYPEYNGTGLILIGQPPIADGDKSYEEVKRLFEPLGLVWGPRFGFSNDYAMVMRSDRATALNMNKISDLSRLVDGVRFVTDSDFLTRPLDGLDAMLRRYGLQKNGEPVSFDVTEKDKIFQTLIDGQVEVAEVFTTDGQIADFGLRVLEDDLKFFPIYEPAPLVRKEALEAFPALQGVLDKLGGVITNEEMREMNRLVEARGQTFQTVAQNFLIEKGLIQAGEATPVAEAEKLNVAVGFVARVGESSLRAARAVRKTFPDRDIQVLREARPLDAIVEGRTRLAVAGANEFFTLNADSPFPTVKDKVEALGVVTYNMAHVVTKFGNYVASLTDLKRVGVGPAGGTSQQAAEMVLAGLELTGQIELVPAEDIDAMFQQLEAEEVDGLLLMVPTRHAKLLAVMNAGRFRLLGIPEWKEGNAMLRFPFLRLAAVPAGSYEGQPDAVETISAQVVLAGPAPAASGTVGESGPGYIPGVVGSLPLPVPASATLALAEALGAGERVDPKIPTSAALAPKRPTPPPDINVAPAVSVTNLLAIAFMVFMLYLFVREEREHQ